MSATKRTSSTSAFSASRRKRAKCAYHKLDKMKHLIDADVMPKCRLPCANCHNRKTWLYDVKEEYLD